MKMKHVVSALSLATCAALSTSAFAQNTLNISGAISPVSCTPTLTGSGLSGSTLTLADGYTGSLNFPGAEMLGGDFTFNLSGCITSGTINNVWAHFSGGNVESGTGRIIPTTGSANVRFVLKDGTTSIVAGGAVPFGTAPTATQGTSALFAGANPNRSATKTYHIYYHALTALSVADAGAVTSDVTYNLIYH